MKDLRTLFLLMLTMVLCFASCDESSEPGEYDNWQERNSNYIDSIADVARSNADGTWRVILADGLDSSKEWGNEYYVYCKSLQAGSGNTSPAFTDSVTVNYCGRLIPTKSYPQGFVFDSNYDGELDTSFDVPVSFPLSSTVSGFYAAVQNMVKGDIWRVFIPSPLGYGVSGTSGIPGYSTLIFDINLVSFAPGRYNGTQIF